MNDVFANMLWLPFPLPFNGREYILKNCDFKPFVDAGGAGAIFEMNDPHNMFRYNPYLANWVGSAYVSRIPVFGVFTIDIPLYMQQFPDYWDKKALFPNDKVLTQLTSDWGGIRNKEIHGLILRFINTADKSGVDLPENWIRNCLDVILCRYRDIIPTVKPGRITGDEIFTMIDPIIESKYDLSTVLMQEKWCVVDQPVIAPTPIKKWSYQQIFDVVPPDYHPNITLTDDWVFSRCAINKWQDPRFNYGLPIQEAVIGSAVSHYTKQQLRAKFVPQYDPIPEPEEPPIPEEPPVPPEPTTFTYEKESIFDILEEFQNIKNTIDQVSDILYKKE